ncbi:MAG: DUF1565 domain-containing protein [Merismopedia sp. SIO2A8]|nr:DUF1565 domain-containing protein [Merismopedia sp. SIO2A8]
MAHSSLYPTQFLIYVDGNNGDDSWAGTVAAPYRTLTHALSQAIAGTLISVAPGTYSTEVGEQFPLMVPPGVGVVGDRQISPTSSSASSTETPTTAQASANANSPDVKLLGGGIFESPALGPQSVTIVLDHNSILRGVTITNPTDRGTGVWIETATVTLRNCQLIHCHREGGIVATGGNLMMTDCIVEDNGISGLLFLQNGHGTIQHNTFRQTGYGIAIRDAAAPTVIHNHFMGNPVGIAVADGETQPVILNNQMLNNQRDRLGLNTTTERTQEPEDFETLGRMKETGATLMSLKQVMPMQLTTEVADIPSVPALFPDLVDHWAQPFIEHLHQYGVIQGFPDGTFQPNASLTRAQYAALLDQMFDLPAVVAPRPFRDVSENFWAAAAIQQASTMEFIAGFPDGTFRPNNALTRAQAIVSLVNGLRLVGGDASDITLYSDYTDIPTYAKEEVATATYKGLVVNHPSPSQLQPTRPITRAEMATMLYQVKVITGQVQAIASPFLVEAIPTVAAFTDVPNHVSDPDHPDPHWAAEFIYGLADRRLINGAAPNQFAPERAMSRAEYATVLAQVFNPLPQASHSQALTSRTLASQRPNSKSLDLEHIPSFVDVPSEFWAAEAIQRVVQAGLLSGFNDGSFQPNQDIKRWQLWLSVVKALNLPETDSSILPQYYIDVDSVPALARGAIATATQQDLVVNYPNPYRLNASRGATRAEVATTLYQSLAFANRLPHLTSPYQPIPVSTPHPIPAPVPTPAPAPTPVPTSPTLLLLPTLIFSAVPPIAAINDLEEYLFGHSNQAQSLAQRTATYLQEQGFHVISHYAQSPESSLDHLVPTDSDVLIRFQVLDRPREASAHASSDAPSINDVAWWAKLYYLAQSQPGLNLAKDLYQMIQEQTGLGDRGLQSTHTLWPEQPTSLDRMTPDASVLLQLEPVDNPADGYPPIPMASLVQAIAMTVLRVTGEP